LLEIYTFWRTRIVTFGLSYFCLMHSTLAGWDSSVSAQGRSYPASATIDLELAYYHFHGKMKDPFSSYFRMGLEGSTAGVFNSGTAFLEIFPLSIFGIGVKQSMSEMSRDYAGYECEGLSCQGRFDFSQAWGR